MFFVIVLTSGLFVFCKAFQQRNVTMDKKLTIFPMSMAMGVLEFTSLGIGSVTAVNSGIAQASILGIASGIGGTVGCILAIELHKKLHKP